MYAPTAAADSAGAASSGQGEDEGDQPCRGDDLTERDGRR